MSQTPDDADPAIELDSKDDALSDRADVPEADALEQSRPATLEDEDELPSEGADVPEADALEQSRAVPPDDEQ